MTLAGLLLVAFGCSVPPQGASIAEAAGSVEVDVGERPTLAPGTQFESERPGYRLLGWEPSAGRFWVVTDRQTVDDDASRDAMLLEIHSRFRRRLELDAVVWSVSFFANERDAHSKPFPPASYLAEYCSCLGRPHEANRINLRPLEGRWRSGPPALECAAR